MQELSPPCQRTDKQEGLGCLCRRLQTHPMDSLLRAEPRETWVQSFHQCVSFPPHRAFLALCGVSLTAASETFLSGALVCLLAEDVLWGVQVSVVEARGPGSGAARGLVAPVACGIFTYPRRALVPCVGR